MSNLTELAARGRKGAPSGTGSRASHQAAARPSAGGGGIVPYELTDPRAEIWLDGYQAALRWMKESLQ